MEVQNIHTKHGPEYKIQQDIIQFLRNREWFVKSTHGNMYSHGWADLYACHRKYGSRWIEVKQPVHFSFTAAQQEEFPLFIANGVGIWILTAATESEYSKLWQPCNYHTMLAICRCGQRRA